LLTEQKGEWYFHTPILLAFFLFSNKTNLGFYFHLAVKILGIIYKVKIYTIRILFSEYPKLSHTHIIYKIQNSSVMRIDLCH
jgi:hypothetical protein